MGKIMLIYSLEMKLILSPPGHYEFISHGIDRIIFTRDTRATVRFAYLHVDKKNV